MSDLDLDAIERWYRALERPNQTVLALVAEVRRLRDRVATLEGGIRGHAEYGRSALPHQTRAAPHDLSLWSLLDASHDQEREVCAAHQYETHSDPHRPPDPPPPTCHLEPGHTGNHEGRTASHRRLVRWA